MSLLTSIKRNVCDIFAVIINEYETYLLLKNNLHICTYFQCNCHLDFSKQFRIRLMQNFNTRLIKTGVRRTVTIENFIIFRSIQLIKTIQCTYIHTTQLDILSKIKHVSFQISIADNINYVDSFKYSHSTTCLTFPISMSRRIIRQQVYV